MPALRWDRYHLVVDDNAFSPRVAVAWSWPSADLVLRASYDRAFQTPAVENLLLASSESVGLAERRGGPAAGACLARPLLRGRSLEGFASAGFVWT